MYLSTDECEELLQLLEITWLRLGSLNSILRKLYNRLVKIRYFNLYEQNSKRGL